MSIRAGLSVRIVIAVDPASERIQAKGSTVYEVNGKTAILAQTNPPILKSKLHKDVVVTYLVKKKNVTVRNGFPVQIMEFIDYRLSSGQMVKALVVDSIGEVRPYNFRMFYRVEPTSRSGLSMAIQGTPINVLDISLGGAKFSYDKSLKLQPDALVDASIGMNGRSYRLEARIFRTWDGISQGFSDNLWFATMEFVSMDKTVQNALSRKIFAIERESLQKERLP